uniref:DENN domain-containing protein 4C n=2 Tax=Cacopsylla melanoneura TaxID=428564 RepID=A0A8D8XMR9_9HEMI
MDDRRVADYFVVCGLPDEQSEWEEETSEHGHYKSNHNDAPITDLAVIFPTLGEFVPDGYDVIKSTPTGLSADLNHGSFKSPEVFLCYRRGRDKPPLVDVGIMYDGKEKILPDSEIVSKTPEGRCANVNNSTSKTFVTYRRAPPTLPPNTLVVTDICVIITSKLETPPHAFCVINKNLNRGLVGSDVFLCYKKSMNSARSLVYKPRLLTQYPDLDRPDFAFPRSVPIFCLPMGATLEAWPSNCQRPSPIFSTFVLTVSDAVEKVYGSAITFYEPYPASRVTPEQRHKLRVQCEVDSPTSESDTTAGPAIEYHTNKCLCLLSHWPFFHTFEKFLLFLYAAAQDREPLAVPIERMISHLLEDIPFPSVHRPRILVQLSLTERLILTQPEDLPLPRSGASFRQLLLNLGPDNSLLLLLCTLTEQKLLIHSLRPDVLTSVAEAVSMIIFPFKWQCPYIPLCPLSLAEVLHAPLPFLIGVDSRFFDLFEPPPDVNCVDLDTNNITVCEDKRYLTIKQLPKKPARTLRHTLTHLYHTLILLMRKQQINETTGTEVDHASAGSSGRKVRSNSVADLPGKQSSIDSDFKIKREEQLLELEIQEAFLRFMASVFKGYRGFLVPITKAPTVGATDTSSLFDLDGFLRSRDRTHQKFFAMTVRTQMFIRFIEVRSFVSDMDTGLTFFDECTEKVENEDEHKLLDLDDSQRSERTVFIMPPEPEPGCHKQYSYANGFRLDPALFHYNRDRPPPHHLDLESKPGGQAAPGSPMARRTKHEIKVAAKLAARCAAAPELWGKCLLSTCHSIWFIQLPSYISVSESKVSILRSAYELLARAQKYGIHPTDEVCYRVMMQLCGLYSQPVLAVKLLFLMRRCGIQPNAITYGFYNRAVLEAKWSSDMYNSSQLLWHKLRNVIIGAGLLRRAVHTITASASHSSGEEGRKRRLQYNGGGDSHHADISSLDSGQGGEQTVHKMHVTPATTIRPTICVDDVPLDDSQLDSPETSGSALIQISHDLSRKPPIGNAPGSIINPSGNALNSSNDTLVGFQAFDRFRRRVGSIVKPSGMTLFNPGTVTRQQSFESSAGLLMTGGTISDTERLDSLLNNLPPLHTRMPPPKRKRSGSCTEISFVNNPASVVVPGNAAPVPNSNVNNSNSYLSKSTNHKRHSHHHHHHHHSSKKNDGGDKGYSKLLRSKSFAHDAQILEKLRDMKSEMTSLNSGIAAFRSSPATSTPSRLGLGGRKASLNRVRESPGDESTESSQEYLNISIPGEGGSTFGSALGSLDELDAKDGLVVNNGGGGGGGGTPKRLANSSRILSALNAKMERLRTGGEERERGRRRNSVDSGGSLGREESGVCRMMSSNDSLHSVSSPSKHPVSRTLVTENDPLGALELESHPVVPVQLLPKSESRLGSEIKLDQSGAPVLFDRRKEYSGGVTRSQTFHSEEDDLAGIRTPNSPVRKPTQYMHRSSTMPFQQRPSDEPGSPARKSSTSTTPATSAFKLPSFSSPAK